MDFLGPACGFAHCLWPCFVRRLSYVKDLDRNFKTVKEELKDLCKRREDVNTEINRDTTSKVPSKECQGWLAKVKEMENQANNIETEITSNRKCLQVCCFPDILARKRLGQRVVAMLDDVTRLKESSAFKGSLVIDAPLEIVENVPSPVTQGQKAIDVLVERILGCIKDDKIRKIGLWGMGGVGKTTVMKVLNNLSETARTFEVVIWVTVSKEWTVRKIQDEILQRLHMNVVDNESDDRIARRLFQKLGTMKYLLLLDDVWGHVDLEEVGICEQDRSKIILTTRYLDVCKAMDTDVEIKVETLSDEEAWNLFRGKVGETVDSEDIEPIARLVFKECDGLPLAIIVIGGSLRKVKDIHVWQNALHELRSASFQIGDMEDRVFKRLKFSYDRLKNDEKNCFLYCSLYPEDCEIPIAELVEHWRAEGFTYGTQKLDKAYDKAHAMLNILTNASLLERSENCVKMHDVIRDLALRITSLKGEGPEFLVKSGLGIEECPIMKEWDEAERISLMDNKLFELPESPRCKSLFSLLLQINRRLNMIPELFFKRMRNLRVLNLCYTDIRGLPPSVSYLVNLRGLYLIGCSFLETLPSEIRALDRLEVLYICVESLPLEVRQLTGLRSLRVQFCGEQAMKTICSSGVISSLCNLEDLRIHFSNWGLLKQWCEMVNIAVAEELGSLKHLTSLRFEFSTIEFLENFIKQRETMNCPEWRAFNLSILGSFPSMKHVIIEELDFGDVIQKELRWCQGERVSSGIIQLLSQAFYFELYGHETAQNLSGFEMKNMTKLRTCKVENCTSVETVVQGNSPMNAILPSLKELYLGSLPKLRSICDPPQRFTALVYLEVYKCSKLKCVFRPGMIQHMLNLEQLIIRECKDIEEIVSGEAEKDAPLFFPTLKTLFLQDLDKLVRLWKGASQSWPSLEHAKFYYCRHLRSLNLNVVDNASVLRSIEGPEDWWDALQWDQDNVKQQLQPLFVPKYY